MYLVKRKTFEFDDDLAARFEEFCSARRLVEKQVVVALVDHFMGMGPDERESLLVSHPTPRPRIAAKKSRGKTS